MSFKVNSARVDQLLGWARGAGSWRADVREVVATPDLDGGINRRVLDVLIPPDGPTYRAENSRLDRNAGAGEFADFAVLATNSFVDLVDEADKTRALLVKVRDQLDEVGRREVDQLLEKPTFRSMWDQAIDSWA